jgi:hypothetical protein
MDQYITEKTLQTFHISLAGHDQASLLEHLNEILQERVGTEIAATLDDTKLKELIDKQETASDEEMGVWLMQNVPELQQIVEDEIGILMSELDESADTINKLA